MKWPPVAALTVTVCWALAAVSLLASPTIAGCGWPPWAFLKLTVHGPPALPDTATLPLPTTASKAVCTSAAAALKCNRGRHPAGQGEGESPGAGRHRHGLLGVPAAQPHHVSADRAAAGAKTRLGLTHNL